MGNTKQTWVERYEDFGAVLACTNKLRTFHPAVELRAFQTFGWDDVSAPGTGPAFQHAYSEVVIRYSKGAIAILRADDFVSKSFDDLLHPLYYLGWRHIEVHHPIEALDRLLIEMGRKIPGSLQDIKLVPAHELGSVKKAEVAST